MLVLATPVTHHARKQLTVLPGTHHTSLCCIPLLQARPDFPVCVCVGVSVSLSVPVPVPVPVPVSVSVSTRYAISPSGSPSVNTPGVFQLRTHPTLSRRAILSALLRHGAHVLIFGTIGTREDIMQMMEAVYTVSGVEPCGVPRFLPPRCRGVHSCLRVGDLGISHSLAFCMLVCFCISFRAEILPFCVRMYVLLLCQIIVLMSSIGSRSLFRATIAWQRSMERVLTMCCRVWRPSEWMPACCPRACES